MIHVFLATALLTLFPAADPSTPAHVSDPNFHGWLMYFGDHPIAGKWGVHLEAQWRRSNGFTGWQQAFYRTAVNYDVTKNLQLTGGYAFVKTYPYGDFPVRQAFDEHRIYQQVVYRHPWKRVRMQYRGRFEQRWIDVQKSVPVGPLPHLNWRLQERVRLYARMDVPLSQKYYLAFYDELLLHAPPNLPVRMLDQNRAYGALGYRVNSDFRVEMGYLHQHLAQRNGYIVEDNHTIQLAIYSNMRLRRKSK